MKKRSGQILILVLLVVVVALAVGLSVASRNITNLRTSTQTEQSQRAFSAAEGGVEDVLSRLGDVKNVIAGTGSSPNCTGSGGQANCSPTIGSLQAQVNVQTVSTYQQVVDEGNVGQIDLEGPSVTMGTAIQIEWALTSDTSESGFPASIEVTQISGSGGGPYNQVRTAWAGVGSRSNEAGFASPNCSSTTFARCTQIPISANPLLLRIRPFWNKATVRVSSVGGSLPVQSYNLTSTASTPLGITRKVQVTRTAKPQLPAVFDYVLFSEGDIVK